MANPVKAFIGGFSHPLLDFAKENLFGGVVEDIEGLLELGEEAWGYVEEVIDSDGAALLEYIVADTADHCSNAVVELELCNQIISGGESIIEVMERNTGALGLPVPSEYQTDVVDTLLDGGVDSTWAYVGNPTELWGDIKNAADRGMAQMQSESVLGREGQEAMQQRIENNKEIARVSNDLGTRALSTSNSGKLLQMMALMEAQQTILSQQQANNSELNRIDQQIGNLNLANISETLDSEKTRKSVDKQITYEGLIQSVNGLSMY